MPNKRPSKKQRISLELTPEAYGELARLAGLAGRDVDEYAAAFLDDALARRTSRKVGVSYRSTLAIREEVAWFAKCQGLSANDWLAGALGREMDYLEHLRARAAVRGPRSREKGRLEDPRSKAFPHPERLVYRLPEAERERLSAKALCGYQIPYELRSRVQAEARASGATSTDVFNLAVLDEAEKMRTRYVSLAHCRERGEEPHMRPQEVFWWRPWDAEGHPPMRV